MSKPRLAVVCDYPEEGWASMDLCAEMLHRSLAVGHAEAIEPRRICPSFRPRVARMPLAGRHRTSQNIDRALNRHWDYPRWLKRQGQEFDLFHLIDHSYAQLVHQLPPERAIVSCNDLDTFRCLLHPTLERRSWILRLMARRILNGLRKAACVTCISSATRDELLRRGLVAPDRTVVVHLGVDDDFSPKADPAADEQASKLLPAINPEDIRILHVGSTIPRKRIDVLLHVFAAVREKFPQARLIRAGGRFTASQLRLLRQLHLQDTVVELPFLERRVLAAVYRQATLVLQPSDREGFGLPIIEALACGVPVVATDLTVLREVGGSAVTYCPSGNVVAWGDKVAFLLDQWQSNPSRRHADVLASLTQAAAFSWKRYAAHMMEVYSDVLSTL